MVWLQPPHSLSPGKLRCVKYGYGTSCWHQQPLQVQSHQSNRVLFAKKTRLHHAWNRSHWLAIAGIQKKNEITLSHLLFIKTCSAPRYGKTKAVASASPWAHSNIILRRDRSNVTWLWNQAPHQPVLAVAHAGSPAALLENTCSVFLGIRFRHNGCLLSKQWYTLPRVY